jgi:hypothetical protein
VAVAAWTHRSATSTRALYFVASGFQIVGTFGIAVAAIELPLP